MEITNILSNLGFYSYQDKINDIKQLLKTEVDNTNNLELKKIESHPSFISLEKSTSKTPLILVIDIGGTSTKAAIRTLDNQGNEHWRYLFEVRNLELGTLNPEDHSFELFCEILSKMLMKRLKSEGINHELPISIGVVWSNAMESFKIEGVGVGADIAEVENYQKGEWFTRDLKNGDKLSQYFLDFIKDLDLNLKNFVIANDTPLTLKATPNASAGVVASTGLNATIIKTPVELGLAGDANEQIICNTEMGDRVKIGELIGTEADYINPDLKALSIEHFSSGLFLPCLFTSHILTLAEKGLTELEPIAKELISLGDDAYKEFRSRDLSLLISGDSLFTQRRTHPSAYSQEAIDILAELAKELILRSASLCGLTCYMSISNLDPSQDLIISLDSRLAREIDIFWEELQKTFYSLDDMSKVTVNLVEPILTKQGSISAPLIGTANALDCMQ